MQAGRANLCSDFVERTSRSSAAASTVVRVMIAANPAGRQAPAELSFRFLSGRICLAFCATVGERWGRNIERLATPADLGRWYADAGVTNGPIPVSEAGLRRSRVLREAIYQAAKALIAHESPGRRSEDIINAAASSPPMIPVLRSLARSWAAPESGGEAAALSVLARDAIDLFTGPQRRRIRECASSQCGLLFVDLSRPGRRRWCSSDACGGKARAAAYRQRRSARIPRQDASGVVWSPL